MQPIWMEHGLRELETKEIPGEEDNPRIVEYHKCTSLRSDNDETPWCSAFVNWCLERSGIKGTNSAAARSFLDWGTVLDEPREGCIVILKRGAPPSGHVCFYAGSDSDTAYFRGLGGNQSNSVKCSRQLVGDILGYRWPKGRDENGNKINV